MKLRNFLIGILGLATLTVIGATSLNTGEPEDTRPIVKRTWNSDHYDNGDGTVTGSFKQKWINYMEEDESWQPIDTSFTKVDDVYVMDNAPFTAIIPERSTGTAIFVSDNLWDLDEKEKIEEEPLAMAITAVGVDDVEGELVTGDLGWGESEYMVYEDAYTDADLIYYVHKGVETNLKKLVRFNSNPNAIADVLLDFDLAFSDEVKVKNWDESKNLRTNGNIAIKRNEDSPRGIGLQKFYVWDSSEEGNTVSVEVDYKKNGDGYQLTKIIPKDYLDSAVYPVYTDASFTPDAGTNTTDGEAARTNANDSWAGIRDGAGTFHASSDGGNGSVTISTLSSDGLQDEWLSMMRCPSGYDTSSIGAGTTVSTATIKLYVSDIGLTDFDDGLNWTVVTLNTTNTMADADFNIANYVDTPLSDTSIDPSTLVDDSYNTWTFNAAGITAIDQTGISEFAMRSDADIADTAPAWAADDTDTFTISTSTVSSQAPVLEVTYITPIASISNIYGVAAASITTVNGVAMASIAGIN